MNGRSLGDLKVKTYQKYFWMTSLLTAISLLLVWSHLRNIPSQTDPVAIEVARDDSVPAVFHPAPPIFSEPPSPSLVSVESPLAPVEPSAIPGEDPEKIAVLIAALGEVEVREGLGSLPDQDLTGNRGRLLLRRWAELNPNAAVNWLSQVGDAGVRRELTDVLAIAWSDKDLPGALTWVESLPESPAKDRALADLGYEVARVDSVNALQIAAQLPASDYANELLIHSMAQYASADPEQSAQLALSLPEGSLRDRTVSSVATILAKQDGGAAASFAVNNIPPGPELDRAVVGVVQLWSQDNVSGSQAWVYSLPDSFIRDQLLQSLGIIGAH